MLLQNQYSRDLINVRKMFHKHSNKDLSYLQELSPGMQVNANQVSVTVSDSGLCCCLSVNPSGTKHTDE